MRICPKGGRWGGWDEIPLKRVGRESLKDVQVGTSSVVPKEDVSSVT